MVQKANERTSLIYDEHRGNVSIDIILYEKYCNFYLIFKIIRQDLMAQRRMYSIKMRILILHKEQNHPVL